jgi:hypothetical protein
MKTITLSNIQIYIAFKALEKITLSGQPSFARRRFLRSISPFVTDLEAERKDLLHKYAQKNGDELKVDGNEYVFTAKNRKQYNREFEVLNSLHCNFDVSESDADDVKSISGILSDEATRLEELSKDGMNADTFDYVQYLKEISSLLKYE